MIYNDILLFTIEILSAILLYILAGYAVKVISNKWRICYCIPAIICLFMTAIFEFQISMLGVYIGSVIMLAGFLKDSEIIRKKSCITAFICIIVSLPVCLLYKGYRAVNYVNDFKNGFKCMKEHYILSEHKGIDWDSLYEEYLPQFQEANRNQDEVSNYIAWTRFNAEFNDGHINFMPKSQKIIDEAGERVYGNDYGLSLMSLSDGKIVAVNVEENSILTESGIHNGTVVTLWDGQNPLDVAVKSRAYEMLTFADKDNENFYLAVLTAGVGGDSVKITYLDENEEEKELILPKIGNYYNRATDTLDIINQGVDTGHLSWVDINEDTACLRIKLMMYDDESEKSGYNNMKSEIKNKVEELKENGVENLIIDLRNNGGGSGHMVKALAELFAPMGEHYYCTDGLWNDKAGCYVINSETGKYEKGKDNYYTGEDIWAGNEIIILVNANSISAADHLTMIMNEFDNITIMGFTETNGSAQGIGGIELESGSFAFSNALLLDENGDVFVDSDISRENGNDIDIKIPFDENAVKALFDNEEDYILNQALKYFSSN